MAKASTFTVKYLDSLKPKDKQYRVVEGRGFALRVLPSGTKSFSYRFTLDGKKQELSLGVYTGDKDNLADAHEKYRAAYAKLQKGIDPRHVESTKEMLTFKHFSDLYLTEYSAKHHKSKSWQTTVKLSLNKDVLPFWSDKDVKDITRTDGQELLKTVVDRGSPGQARNVYKVIRAVLQYAIDWGPLDYNVLLGLSKTIPALRSSSRDRVLTEQEIKHVWHSLDDSPISRALKLILVTAQRPGEVAGMHTDELQAGIGKELCKTCKGCSTWTIPAERAEKGQGEHIVYLTKTAVDLTRGIEEPDGLVFDIQRGSLSQYLSRDKNYLGLPRWTPHDLRRTARTEMPRIGIIDEHAEAVLAHKKPGMAGIYNKYAYVEEKKEALIKWETELLRIVS
jgi:integrase